MQISASVTEFPSNYYMTWSSCDGRRSPNSSAPRCWGRTRYDGGIPFQKDFFWLPYVVTLCGAASTSDYKFETSEARAGMTRYYYDKWGVRRWRWDFASAWAKHTLGLLLRNGGMVSRTAASGVASPVECHLLVERGHQVRLRSGAILCHGVGGPLPWCAKLATSLLWYVRLSMNACIRL